MIILHVRPFFKPLDPDPIWIRIRNTACPRYFSLSLECHFEVGNTDSFPNEHVLNDIAPNEIITAD